jgi:hypothetical protein
MALLKKERAVSSILNTIIIGTSVIVADLIIGLIKVPILEVVKPEPFYKSR